MSDPGKRVIDASHVRSAAQGLGNDPEHISRWALRFAVLADPSRLALLICIHYADGICVSDLAAASGMKDTAVSQALRLLRAQGLVTAQRDGRAVRYRLADEQVHELIHRVRPHGATECE